MQALGRSVNFLAQLAALAGGVVLIGLVVLTAVSVAGRSIPGLGPVTGDFELVEIGMGFAIFSFLPWCHLRGSHAAVDLLFDRLGAGLRRFLALVSDAVMLALAVLIAWRLGLGMADKRLYGDTTYLLQIPLWWAYAAAMPGAAIFAVAALWRLLLGLAAREP